MPYDYKPNLSYEKKMMPIFTKWAKTELGSVVENKTGDKGDFEHERDVLFDGLLAQVKFRRYIYTKKHLEDNKILVPIKDPRVLNGGQAISNDNSRLFITVYPNEKEDEIVKVIFCSTINLKKHFELNPPNDLKETHNNSGTQNTFPKLEEIEDCVLDIWSKPKIKQGSLEEYFYGESREKENFMESVVEKTI